MFTPTLELAPMRRSTHVSPTRSRRALARAAFALATLGATTTAARAQSGQFTDPAGDFLATYTAGPRSPDLDVLSGAFRFDGSAFLFSGTLAGAIGTTPGALYVWGINRGQGTARVSPALPNTQNVLFDAVVILAPGGTSSVRDLLTNTAFTLGPSDVSFTGASFFARVGAGLLSSTGFAPGAYTANFWPRLGLGSNDQVADFAPDNANVAVATVPEPGTWALLGTGLTLLGGVATRRRQRGAARVSGRDDR